MPDERTLQSLVNDFMDTHEMTLRQFCEVVGASTTTISEIRSGEWDKAIREKKWNGRKLEHAPQVMARTVLACQENPVEWARKFGFSVGSMRLNKQPTSETIPDERSLRSLLVSFMNKHGLSNRDFANLARVSFRAVSEVRSGKWDKAVGSGSWSKRKLEAAPKVMSRVVLACGENPKEWAGKFGFPTYSLDFVNIYESRTTRKEYEAVTTLEDVVTADDVEHLRRAQEVLGNSFTIEIALRLIRDRHNEE